MDNKDTYDLEGQVSLKEHILTLMERDRISLEKSIAKTEERNQRELDVYKHEVNIHLLDLNNSHANIEKIAAKNIGTDKFDGLELRVASLEKERSAREGGNKVTDVVKYLIGVFIGSLITGIILSLLK